MRDLAVVVAAAWENIAYAGGVMVKAVVVAAAWVRTKVKFIVGARGTTYHIPPHTYTM